MIRMDDISSKSSHRLKHSIRIAISYLENERKQSYDEAAHKMRFPKNAGFTSDNETHIGLTFQLTIIIDALLSCEEAGFTIDTIGLGQDIEQIINLKDNALNAWKYFPTLPELPPDIDDLAQIIQIFKKIDDPRLDTTFLEMNELIARNANSDGSINTWIFDHDNQNENYGLMLRATKTMWGDKSDVEVIANYLYSLFVLDHSNNQDFIIQGIPYIVKKQNRQGYWKSTWYWGKYYGSYMCTRLLVLFPELHRHLYQTMKFIVRSQNSNGSWGELNNTTNDTAFAVLTLLELHNQFPDVMDPVTKGVNYLMSIQNSKGFWQASRFIRMKTDRVSGPLKFLLNLRYSNVLSYQSNTVTTAVILKSLCQYYRLLYK